MKKEFKIQRYSTLRPKSRIGLIFVGLLLVALLFRVNTSKAQSTITLKLTNVSLQEAIEKLKEQTGIDLIYNHEKIATAPKVTIDFKVQHIKEALDIVLKSTGFTYKEINETIVITEAIEIDQEDESIKFKQTLRGRIIDKDSKSELPFATVQIMDLNPSKGTTSDVDGNFKIENIPVGRYTIKVSFVGYEDAFVNEVLIGTGKESVITIELTERLTALDAVVVTAGNGSMMNEMAVVSGKSFDAEETKRYAASISDPARMVQVLAGVSGTDDASNEIVIRGNSPNWMLWKLEGVEIPSPNHFAEEGYTSGAVSILSANMLGRSDFYTGAFSADYGNALSGVFDLRLRNGNNQDYEHTFQAGVLGFDIASEGPFNKNYDGSYLFNYRYSTLSILNDLNIEVSENALPNYQDLSFKVNLPTENIGTFSLWGIGGLSDAIEKYLPDSTSEYFEDGYRDFTYAGMYATGITHTYFPDNSSYFETVFSRSKSFSRQDYEVVDSTGVLYEEFYDNLQKGAWRLSSYYNRKYSSRLSIRFGAILSRLDYDYISQERDEETMQWETGIDSDGNTNLYQGYTTAKYKFSSKIVATFGAHYTYFVLNQDQVIEPRLGLAIDLGNKQKLTAGYGLHSRHENLPVYFVEMDAGNGQHYMPNKDLELTRANHFVLGYEKMITSNLLFKTEIYYQDINKLPVSNNPDKYGTPIFGGFVTEDTLVNKGKGRNYGLELTLQKYFSNKYYFLVTSSLFDSKYMPLDGNWYNSLFNINYVNNVVGGKEFKWGDNKLFGINAKVTWSGGKRQLPIDLDASKAEGETVYIENKPWSFKTKDYFRIDMGMRVHFYKSSTEHVLSLDVQNVTNRLNIWSQYYDSEAGKISDYTMAGLIPVLSYRIEF